MIDNVTVGTSSTRIVAENLFRQKLILVNNSNEDIYVAPGAAAISTAGVALKASGGTLIDEPDAEGYLYTGPWWGICTSGGKVLSVTELSRQTKRKVL